LQVPGVPPSAPHKPFVHSKLLVHVVPMGPVATQAGVALHQKPVAQPALVAVGAVPVTVHVLAQAVPLAHAKLVGQAAVAPASGLQVPVPLHEPAGVSELPVHEAAQAVPDAVSSQTAPVVQLPVSPHGGAAVH
jgi:hypothetical protein